jgi:hypothetical protein
MTPAGHKFPSAGAVDPKPPASRPLKCYARPRADRGEDRISNEHDDAELPVLIIVKRNDDEVDRLLRRT